MRCPVCKSEHLVRSERSGIETDYCPKCRAWLNRDELERDAKGEKNRKGESPGRAESSSVTDNRPPLPQDPKNRRE